MGSENLRRYLFMYDEMVPASCSTFYKSVVRLTLADEAANKPCSITYHSEQFTNSASTNNKLIWVLEAKQE